VKKMITLEALKNFQEKWKLFMVNMRENFSFYEFCLGFLLIGMGIFFLSIAYTILLNGGLEYSVRIGNP